MLPPGAIFKLKNTPKCVCGQIQSTLRPPSFAAGEGGEKGEKEEMEEKERFFFLG